MIDAYRPGELQFRVSQTRAFLRYHWDYYSALAHLRSEIRGPLQASLHHAATGPIKLHGWHRATSYKRALNPLSSVGSLLGPGGRFNIGTFETSKFHAFPGLYLAENHQTAILERFKEGVQGPGGVGLSGIETALRTEESIVSITCDVALERIIDLGNPKALEEFVSLIRGFRLPVHLDKQARSLGLPPPDVIRTVDILVKAVLDPSWRNWSEVADVPSQSQIFGEVVHDAGIEGILYGSKYGGGRCVVVFPENLQNSDGFVELVGDVPVEGQVIRRLDRKTCLMLNSPLTAPLGSARH